MELGYDRRCIAPGSLFACILFLYSCSPVQLTSRIVSVDEDYQWQLNTLLTSSPSRTVVEQDVQMSSEVYRVVDDKLIWRGQSISSSRSYLAVTDADG